MYKWKILKGISDKKLVIEIEKLQNLKWEVFTIINDVYTCTNSNEVTSCTVIWFRKALI